jgi:hypothetical protein
LHKKGHEFIHTFFVDIDGVEKIGGDLVVSLQVNHFLFKVLLPAKIKKILCTCFCIIFNSSAHLLS